MTETHWTGWARQALARLTPEIEAQDAHIRANLEWVERTGDEPYWSVKAAAFHLGIDGREGDEG